MREPITEIKFHVRNSEKVLATEIFNRKFGWHHILVSDALAYGEYAPIQMGTFPEKSGSIYLRVPVEEIRYREPEVNLTHIEKV